MTAEERDGLAALRAQRDVRADPCPETLYELGRCASALAAAEGQYREVATAPLAAQIAGITPGSLLHPPPNEGLGGWLDDSCG